MSETDFPQNMSLMDKFREHIRITPPRNRFKNISRIITFIQAFSQVYMALQYLIPYVFEAYDPWTIYYLKVFACYLFIMAAANWLCVMLYDTSVIKTKDQPFPNFTKTGTFPNYLQSDQYIQKRCNDAIEIEVEESGNRGDQNGNCLQEKDELSWKYCNLCDMQTPPRSHHCKICKVCILKRDHHCYLTGCCIGFKNQRYFIVMAFYVWVANFLSYFLTYVYLRDKFWPTASLTDATWPVAFYKTIVGDMFFHHTVLLVHLYVLTLFTPLGFVYFASQFTLISQGITPHELQKKIPIRNTLSIDKNFQSVFGDFWLINFLFPGQLLFRQRDDGFSWDGIKLMNMDKKSKTGIKLRTV
ncbi:hypothetical protein SNE40_021567 [Patella caerulea]|uniref:Palmitoyltransferase n=2 Tax=Patella caerulea TaxID=87958 RepID=A0AAN8G4C6_PATCE